MLGPPVCIPCRNVMTLDEKRKRPQYEWYCPLCGQEALNDGTDRDRVSSLFHYPRSEWDELYKGRKVP